MDRRRAASLLRLVYNLSINLTQGHPCCGHTRRSMIKRFKISDHRKEVQLARLELKGYQRLGKLQIRVFPNFVSLSLIAKRAARN